MIEVSTEAEKLIKNSIKNSEGKTARIILHKGGCAGHMLCLTLAFQENTDTIVESHGINFAISNEALEYVTSISICLKNNLGTEIVIKNNDRPTCRCGKSFKL